MEMLRPGRANVVERRFHLKKCTALTVGNTMLLCKITHLKMQHSPQKLHGIQARSSHHIANLEISNGGNLRRHQVRWICMVNPRCRLNRLEYQYSNLIQIIIMILLIHPQTMVITLVVSLLNSRFILQQ